MNSVGYRAAVTVCCLLLTGYVLKGSANAQTLDFVIPQDSPFLETKQAHRSYLAQSRTTQERLDAMRELVRSGPYGERGLRNIFKNFEGEYALDPRILGVERKVLHTTISNPANRKGAARELLIATAVHRNSDMNLIGLDRIVRRSWGATDKDIVLKAYGVRCRIEVKNVTPAAQRADLGRLLGQIRKMGKERRLTDEQQVIISRHKLDPRLIAEAREQGVFVYDQVHSGANRHPDGYWDRDAINDLNSKLRKKARMRIIGPSLAIGLGAYSLYSGQDALREGLRNGEDWQVLQGISELGFGTGSLAYGGLDFALKRAGEEATERSLKILKSLKHGSVLLTAVMLAGEEITLLYRYDNGSISAREMFESQCGLAGAGVGTIMGGGIGFVVGIIIPSAGEEIVLTTWGAGIGGFVGGVTGDLVGGKVYNWKFGEVDKVVQRHVLEHYSAL